MRRDSEENAMQRARNAKAFSYIHLPFVIWLLLNIRVMPVDSRLSGNARALHKYILKVERLPLVRGFIYIWMGF